jgi:hypothetical protein
LTTADDYSLNGESSLKDSLTDLCLPLMHIRISDGLNMRES